MSVPPELPKEDFTTIDNLFVGGVVEGPGFELFSVYVVSLAVESIDPLLDGKANVVHGHAIADIDGLQQDLDGKAAAVHYHSIAEVSGLQATLNNLLPVDFAPYLVSNVSAGHDPEDSDRFTVDVTWVYLDPARNYPQQTFVNPIPIASDDRAGLMSKSDVAQLRANTAAIESFRDQGVYIGQSFGTWAELDAFEIPPGARVNDWTTVQVDETKGGNTTRYVIVNAGTDAEPVMEFVFERILVTDAVGLARTGVAGLAVGAADNGQNAGKGYFETDGTISVIGWALLVSKVDNVIAYAADNIPKLEDRIASLEPAAGDIYIKHVSNVADDAETIIGYING